MEVTVSSELVVLPELVVPLEGRMAAELVMPAEGRARSEDGVLTGSRTASGTHHGETRIRTTQHDGRARHYRTHCLFHVVPLFRLLTSVELVSVSSGLPRRCDADPVLSLVIPPARPWIVPVARPHEGV
jgi:hypothetical protein